MIDINGQLELLQGIEGDFSMIHQGKDQRDVPTQIRHLLQSPQGRDLLIKATERKKHPVCSLRKENTEAKLAWPATTTAPFGLRSCSDPPHPFQSEQEAASPGSEYPACWELGADESFAKNKGNCTLLHTVPIRCGSQGRWQMANPLQS